MKTESTHCTTNNTNQRNLSQNGHGRRAAGLFCGPHPEDLPGVRSLEVNLGVLLELLELTHEVEERQVLVQAAEGVLRPPVLVLVRGPRRGDEVHELREREHVGAPVARHLHGVESVVPPELVLVAAHEPLVGVPQEHELGPLRGVHHLGAYRDGLLKLELGDASFEPGLLAPLWVPVHAVQELLQLGARHLLDGAYHELGALLGKHLAQPRREARRAVEV